MAVKLIKPGMASEDILRRFRQERRLLGRLEHPNIARVYDSGLDHGLLVGPGEGIPPGGQLPAVQAAQIPPVGAGGQRVPGQLEELEFLGDGGALGEGGSMITADGEWLVEGNGVHPDIEVYNDPAGMAAGRDLQLEKAVEALLAEGHARGASLGVFSSAQFFGAFVGGLIGGRFLAGGRPQDVFFVCALLAAIWLASSGLFRR